MEEKNTKFIVIIVILIILLSCCIGYIVYDNFIKEDEIVENNDKDNNEENELTEEELNELGETLFNKTNILLASSAGDYMLYQKMI